MVVPKDVPRNRVRYCAIESKVSSCHKPSEGIGMDRNGKSASRAQEAKQRLLPHTGNVTFRPETLSLASPGSIYRVSRRSSP